MPIAEIKSEAQKMTANDGQHLAAYFHHLSCRNAPADVIEIDRALKGN